MILVDTDILTLVFHPKPGITERVVAAREAGALAISVFVRVEVLRGRFDAVLKAITPADVIRMQKKLAESENFLSRFSVVPFDDAVDIHFDQLVRGKAVRKVGRSDLLIGCIALAHKATFVTRNLRDFAHIPGLKVENWDS